MVNFGIVYYCFTNRPVWMDKKATNSEVARLRQAEHHTCFSGSLESMNMARFPTVKTAKAAAKQLSNLSSLRCNSILVTLEDAVELQ